VKAEDAGKVLNALRLGSQLIHPADDGHPLPTWRKEIEEAIRIQEHFLSNLQKGLKCTY
jgi:hypothetical protein